MLPTPELQMVGKFLQRSICYLLCHVQKSESNLDLGVGNISRHYLLDLGAFWPQFRAVGLALTSERPCGQPKLLVAAFGLLETLCA